MTPHTYLSPDLVKLVSETKFKGLLSELQKEADISSTYACKYDFDEHTPYNGIRTYLKYVQRYFHMLHALLLIDKQVIMPLKQSQSVDMNNNNDEEKKVSWFNSYINNHEYKCPLDMYINRMEQISRDRYESLYEDLHKVGLVLLRHFHIIHNLHSLMVSGSDPYLYSEEDIELEEFGLQCVEEWRCDTMKYLYTPEITLWWLSDSKRKILSVGRHTLSFISSPATKTLNNMISGELRRDSLHKLFFNPSRGQVISIISIANSRVVSLLSRSATMFHTSTFVNVRVPRQFDCGFTPLGELCMDRAPPLANRPDTVETVFIYNGNKKSLVNQKNLILHIHGSGFCVTNPYMHSFYLDAWSVDLKVPIMAPNYSKAPSHPFPHAIQELVDLYLYLTDDNNKTMVYNSLGYVPENFIFTGDSAGCNLALSLMVAIDKINRHRTLSGNGKQLPVPTAVALQYPASTPFVKCSFSRLSHVFDIMLTPGLLFGLSSAYLVPKWLLEEEGPWFLKPRDEAREVYKEFSAYAVNPFVSPIKYEHFDNITQVPCYIQSCEYDVLLDDGIELAKAWAGPVTFDVVPEANHGFMASPLSPKVRERVDEFVNFIRKHLVD